MSPETDVLELYDVRSDPAESKDLAHARPEVVREMAAQLRSWQRSVELSLPGADHARV